MCHKNKSELFNDLRVIAFLTRTIKTIETVMATEQVYIYL